jgi:hypothetical protein
MSNVRDQSKKNLRTLSHHLLDLERNQLGSDKKSMSADVCPRQSSLIVSIHLILIVR